MSEQKPVAFKPAINTKPVEEQLATPPAAPAPVELTNELWAKKISEAKATKETASLTPAETTATPDTSDIVTLESMVDPSAPKIAIQDMANAVTPVTNEVATPSPAVPVSESSTESSVPSTDTTPSDKEDVLHYWDDNAGNSRLKDVPPYIPSEEELKRAEKIKGKKENDASGVATLRIGSVDELVAAFESINTFMSKYKDLTKEDIDAHPEIKSMLEWLNQLRAIMSSSAHTDQQKLMMSMISTLNKNGKVLKALDRKLSISKVTTPLKNTGHPQLLRGSAAMQVINNRYRGVYKIQLHNSGFWVKLMPLRNADMDSWMREVDFERKQLGRLVGGHFYLGMNIYLKQALADLLKLSTVESNLEHWDEGTTLVDSISIHDYDTLCWAFCTMMYRDGVAISTVCVNPECRYHNKEQYLDLARISFINPDVYTEEAMQFMIAGSAPGVIRTQDDIKNYKEKMLKNVRLINFTETDQYELRDPSLGEFVRTGTSLLGKLAAKVKDGKLDVDSPEVRRFATYHLSKMLSPWISRIVLNDENKKIVGVIDDRDAITANLETSLTEEFKVVERIEEFITNSKVSFYAAMSLKCPKCGHQLDLLKDNIFPFDVEYLLFCLSYLKLDQISTTL